MRSAPYLLSVALGATLLGCGSSGASPETSYAAYVSTSEDQTSVDLVRIVVDEGGSPTFEVLGSWGLPYGALKFAIDQGSVPIGTAGVPAECQASTSLGEELAGACVFQPLLDSFSQALAEAGIARSDVGVQVSYLLPEIADTSLDGERYSLAAIESMDGSVGTFVTYIGFKGGLDP